FGLGLAGYLLFPWYALQDGNGLLAMSGVFGAAETANGVMQATSYGRVWLWLGLAGLVVAGFAATRTPGKAQGALLIAGGLFGTLGLGLSGFLIGAKGWSSEALTALFGELSTNQFGMGWG